MTRGSFWVDSGISLLFCIGYRIWFSLIWRIGGWEVGGWGVDGGSGCMKEWKEMAVGS